METTFRGILALVLACGWGVTTGCRTTAPVTSSANPPPVAQQAGKSPVSVRLGRDFFPIVPFVSPEKGLFGDRCAEIYGLIAKGGCNFEPYLDKYIDFRGRNWLAPGEGRLIRVLP
jgi:hypothetical protein